MGISLKYPLKLLILLFFLEIIACGGHVFHVVEKGETLYSISWMYGHDYRKVAQWNGVKPPYVIKKGQRLRVAPPTGQKTGNRVNPKFRRVKEVKRDPVLKVKPGSSDKPSVVKRYGSPVSGSARKGSTGNNRNSKLALRWFWPTRGGRVLHAFKQNDPGKRGLDIIGRDGQPVYSASSGRVVYSGGGLPRYGKLIIVKHNDVFLSAYAHNKRLRVSQGDFVRAGQHIADMGNTGTNRTKLHFEIRRNGKAIDPLRLLPRARP